MDVKKSDKIGWANGILIDTGKARLLFDPTSGRRLHPDCAVFITHAHSDHTYGFSTSARKYSTFETLQIYQALGKRKVTKAQTLQIGESIVIEDAKISVLNAGHMLGSCQFEIQTSKFTAIYTGDINCVDTLTTRAAEQKQCDYLIIEGTYGHPDYVFPRRNTMYADVIRWTMTEIKEGKIPTFQVYSSGKPQEVVRLFNVYTKIPIVCNPAISHANEVYMQNGVNLEFLDLTTSAGKKALKAGGCVYVTTGHGDHLPHNASRAVATGWALRQAFRSYTAFPLSSHADFEQLIHFVSQVNPRRVYIFTGYTDTLANQISSKLGIEAGSLPTITQTNLLDFSNKPT
jgi:putative mRNA 3-end processing factor